MLAQCASAWAATLRARTSRRLLVGVPVACVESLTFADSAAYEEGVKQWEAQGRATAQALFEKIAQRFPLV